MKEELSVRLDRSGFGSETFRRRSRLAAAVIIAALIAAGCKLAAGKPDVPSAPSGPATGAVNVSYQFTVTGTDPAGESVAVLFNWGDGSPTHWSDFASSGNSLTGAKSWSSSGTYDVKAKLLNTKNKTSDWSNPHQIVISGK